MSITKCPHGKLPLICTICRAEILSRKDPSHTRVEPRSGSSNAYYVYENWVAKGHTARIHRGDCSYCNDGEGMHSQAGDKNGTWHGPFETWSAAEEYGLSKTREGRRCNSCGGRE